MRNHEKTVVVNVVYIVNHISLKIIIAQYDIQQRSIPGFNLSCAQLEQQCCKSNFLHNLRSTAFQLSKAQTKSLASISIIHAGGKQGDLFDNK